MRGIMFYQLLKPHIQSSRSLSVKRGEMIYHEGDEPDSLYFIESGLVGLFHISETGKETFLRVFGEDSILGHRSYFAKEPYHGTSIALSNTTLAVISKDQCDKICQEHPELLREVTKILSKNLREAELRLAGLQDKSAHIRISETLVYLKLKYPKQVWTRKEIAEYSCSTFETVTRVMTRLEELKLIEKIGRDFKILDQVKLLNLKQVAF